MKNLRKYGTVLMSLLMCFLMIATVAFADVPKPEEVPAFDQVGSILGLIRWVGIAVGVAMVMFVGVKYLTSGAGKKAEAKETMVPVLIGAVLLMLAPSIIDWIYQMFNGK